MLKPGEVATTMFSFADQTGAKRRPVLVVSSEEFNTRTGDVIVAAISSKPPRDRYEYKLERWKLSGLKLPSKVRAGAVHTVSGLLLKRIGAIPEEEYYEVKKLLTEVLGLNIN